ncbi:MAG: FmdB family zinc ribbon protein [Anaerolineae bacterium]|nr:zinc ribbon domain-containing protein [Anaerolineae bacterium]MDW8098620.1 FmdB family zinc ribbon protein [Anaerolineae bacterium]
MPIYIYNCETCGVQFEEMRSFSDSRVPVCPDGHTNVRRTFSPPAIHFKGSGWYITDSRKRSNGKADGKSESGEKATEPRLDD